MITSTPYNPVCPLAVRGAGTVDIQKWKSYDTQPLGALKYDGVWTVDKKGLGIYNDGTSSKIGRVKLDTGYAFVEATWITAQHRILLSNNNVDGQAGFLFYEIKPGAGFTIYSTESGDLSEVSWLIYEAL